MKRIAWTLVPLMLPVAFAHAADPTPIPAANHTSQVTEAELLVHLADGGDDPRLRVFAARIALARAQVIGAGILPNPTLAYEREELFPDRGSVSENAIRLAWPIDISGRRSRRIAAAEAEVAATHAELASERNAIVLDALALFDEAVYQRLRVAEWSAARDVLAELVTVVEKRVTRGETASYDLQRLALELAAYDDALAGAQLDRDTAQRRLAILVGESGGRRDGVGTLGLPSAVAAEGWGAWVGAEHPDVRTATFRKRAAAASLGAARRGWVPDLIVDAGLKTAEGIEGSSLGYVAGISVALPLFDRAQGDEARARAAGAEAEAQLQVLSARLGPLAQTAAEVLAARVLRAERFASEQAARLPALLRAARAAYHEGDRPIGELIEVQRTARDVALHALELRMEARAAELDLWRTLGRRLRSDREGANP